MTFFQAIVIGLIQGIAELFPVSSLGQTVLIPALVGGSWSGLVAQQASPESPYLAFVGRRSSHSPRSSTSPLIVGKIAAASGFANSVRKGFSFLLSAPPIFAAGLYKLPDLMGPLGQGIRPQILAGSVAAFVTAFLSTRLLIRYFRSGTLLPFAAFCLVFGVACIIRFGVF
jgi:undecaprenyl pyrophosphate phosphatase UppP